LKKSIDERVSGELNFFTGMALRIAREPELSEAEFKTSEMLVEALASRGWSVEYPYLGMPTAFNAVKGRGGGPVVTFMAEYDALPEIGHACGHNLNGVMSLLGGIALADAIGAGAGEVRIVGTPAEETNGAKVEMAGHGVFDDADFAMMVHAAAGVTRPVYRALALVPMQFGFKGLTAHAASSPWEGRNALNAVQLLFHALDMLRQHVRPETRIHGVITKGGDAPNIVPDFAQASFYFRSPSRGYLDKVVEKALDCARGAALCTGTEAEWRSHELSFREILPNAAVESLMMSVLDEIGAPYDSAPYTGGSTDVGDVSWRCPTMHLSLAFTDKKIAAHTREFAAMAADESLIGAGISVGARALARMGLIALTDADARARMRRDLERAREE
jgi:amidohydrolase